MLSCMKREAFQIYRFETDLLMSYNEIFEKLFSKKSKIRAKMRRTSYAGYFFHQFKNWTSLKKIKLSKFCPKNLSQVDNVSWLIFNYEFLLTYSCPFGWPKRPETFWNIWQISKFAVELNLSKISSTLLTFYHVC